MLRYALTLALLFLLAAPAQAEKVGQPVPIGIAVAQTSNVALFGEEQVNGAKIAEAYFNAQGGINGTPIKLIYQDTGGDEAGAVNAFQNLMTQGKVVTIIGPTLSQQAFAADPIADRAKVPVIGPSNTAKGIPQIGDYVGRISAPMTVVAPNSLKQALKINPNIKQVAVLYAQNDAFSSSETTTFQEAIKGLGLQIATLQKFQTTDTDFTTQVTAVLGANVELVVISGLAADSGNLVKQLRQLGYEGLIVGGNGLNSPNMFPVCGKLCEGVLVAQAYSPQADNEMNKVFSEKFKEAYKKSPAQFSAQAFVAVQLVVEGAKRVEAETKTKLADMELPAAREAMNKAMVGLPIKAPVGEISLDLEGEVIQKQFYVSRIKMDADGKTGVFELISQ